MLSKCSANSAQQPMFAMRDIGQIDANAAPASRLKPVPSSQSHKRLAVEAVHPENTKA